MQAYCVKCKTKREISNPQKVTMKNGRKATKGKCPKCNSGSVKVISGRELDINSIEIFNEGEQDADKHE